MNQPVTANPYEGGYRNQNGVGGQFQRQRRLAWDRGWKLAEQDKATGAITIPTCFKMARFEVRNMPLIRYFYRTNETINGWRCSVCATAKQRKVILEEVKFDDYVRAGGDQDFCCRKCGLSYVP